MDPVVESMLDVSVRQSEQRAHNVDQTEVGPLVDVDVFELVKASREGKTALTSAQKVKVVDLLALVKDLRLGRHEVGPQLRAYPRNKVVGLVAEAADRLPGFFMDERSGLDLQVWR